jgi:tetratricopeptide (TPR) repeat protein
MVYSDYPGPAQYRHLSLALHIGLMLSISLPPAQIQASRHNLHQGVNEIAQGDGEPRRLEAGKPIERELSGGESHSYRVTTASGQYLQVVADQRGIDVVVVLFAPDGRKVIEVDSPNGTAGPEVVSAIAEAAGAYRIEVHSLERTAKTGRYEIKVEELRAATAEDKHRVAAESIFQEAKQLEGGTSEARRKSIEKYEEARELYRKTGDRYKEAMALKSIGALYHFLGEPNKALDKFNESLPIMRAINNRRGEAAVINSIGLVYYSLGEMRKTLENLNEALTIIRAEGDRGGEASLLNNIGSVYKLLGEMPKALGEYNEALAILRGLGDRNSEAIMLNNIGTVYQLLGEMRKALEKYNEALPSFRITGDRNNEANTLNNIGMVYQSLGERRKALDNLNEALPITRALGNRNLEAATLDNIGTVYKLSGEMQKALDKFNEVLPIRRAIGDRNGEAITLNNLGSTHSDMGETQKALERYNEALPIFQTMGDQRNEATTLSNIGHVYQLIGEMPKALEKYNEALPLRRAVGDRGGEAATLHNIGQVYYLLGDRQEALEKYNEVLPIFRAVGDRHGEASTLNSLGQTYDSLGEKQKALEKYNEALPIRRAVGDRIGEATTLNNIGAVYWSVGEMQKALEKYNESLPISRAAGNRRGEATALNNIAMVYDSLGDMQKALEKYNEALPIKQAIGDRSGQAVTLHNIGGVYRSSGEMQKALEKYNEALSISRAIGERDMQAKTLTVIGRAHHLLGETQKALESYNEALPISRSIGDRAQEAYVLINFGRLYDSLSEPQKALDRYNEALLLSRAVSDRSGEADSLLGIARAEEKRGNLILARQFIERAIAIIESLRADIGGQDLRASYLASQQEFYRSYIDFLMQMHRRNPTGALDAAALTVSERARARSLLELLTEARADIRQGVDRSLLERERSLQQRLRAKGTAQIKLLTGKHTPAQAEAVAKEIGSITAEYEELAAQIRRSSPKYAALTQPQPLNLAEIQRELLDPDTLLLEYSLGENASYLFVVSHNSIASYQLPKRAEIEAATRRVLDLLTAPQPRPGDTAAKRLARTREARASYWPQAAALSRMLLGPAATQLGSKRLLIAADGAMQYLPFGALPVPEIAGQGDKGTRRQEPIRQNPPVSSSPCPLVPLSPCPAAAPTPLMVEHEIVHLPSASTLAVLRRELAGRQPAPKAVAVLADPVFSADDARVKLAAHAHNARAGKEEPKERPSDLTRALTDVRGELTRLLMTRDEARAILSITPPNARLEALDFRASRAISTSDELGRYRIVHFATHGLLNSEHPNLSGLVLSLVDERGQQQDGFLQLHEIFNLRLSAELVVLSACQTGLGKEIKGEGLVGLTRGFMYAGAARVMASLWQVDDAATAELMKRFYRRMLQEGMRPAAALRAAQVEMWKRPQWQSPYYWGAFVLQGEWR